MLRRCVLVGSGLLVVLAGIVFAGTTFAEEAKKPEIPHGDFLVALDALKDGVQHFSKSPDDPGLYDKHQETWKRYAKPRASRMLGRIKQLAKPRLWGVTEDEPGPARALDEGSWSALVKGTTALYAELGTLRSRYAEQRVTSRHAQKLWVHSHPGPEPIGRVPGRDALDEIAATIREYHYAGLAVPTRLLRTHGRLATLVSDQEAEARAIKRAEYNERKHQAYAAIDIQVSATMAALRGDVDQLRAQQVALQKLMAAAQAIEELRLKALVAKAPTEGDHLEKVPEMFRAMEAGRRAGLRFNDSRSARWGSLVRQKWMTQRAKIETALKRAARAAAEAAALKNEAPK